MKPPIERKQQDFVGINKVEQNETNKSDITKTTNHRTEVNTIWKYKYKVRNINASTPQV